MGNYEVIAFVFCSTIVSIAKLNRINPVFRNDYKYIELQEGFYKVHILPRQWKSAQSLCAAEGSQMVYPSTFEEATVLTTLMNESLPKENSLLWLGAHDLFAEGVYVNLQGEDLSNIFSNWAPDEPNDAGNNEDCIAMTTDGILNDVDCNSRLPFICKKTLTALTTNPTCQTFDLAYVANSDKTSCYKVHLNPKNWTNAFATCHAEQSYLTIINNVQEVQFLVNLLQKIPENNIKVPYYKGHVAIGFHDHYYEGDYLTIHGETLEEAGYNDWQDGQPDNYKGNENCGSMTRQGKLNDITCSNRMLFICERDIGNANVVHLHSRFQITENQKLNAQTQKLNALKGHIQQQLVESTIYK